VWPAHGEWASEVAGAWGAENRGDRCMGSRHRGTEERGEWRRMKKWAEEHKDPPYAP
jgi:hypothetical protein